MPSAVQGLVRGLDLGMGIDRSMRQRESEQIEQSQRDELYDLNKRIKEAQIKEYTDKARRTEALRKVNTAIYAASKGDFNNPAVIDAVNDTMKAEINQGVGGDIAGKRIRRFIPAPDRGGMMIELDVIKKDGSRYTAPWTMNRTADPGDEVAMVTPEEGAQILMEQKDLLTRLEQTAIKYGDDWYTKSARETRQKMNEPRVVGYGSDLVVPDGKGGYRKAYENTRLPGSGGRGGLPGGVAQWKVQQLSRFLPEDLATKVVLAKGAIGPGDKISVLKYIGNLKDEFGELIFKTPEEVESEANRVLDWVATVSPDTPGLGSPKTPPSSRGGGTSPILPAEKRLGLDIFSVGRSSGASGAPEPSAAPSKPAEKPKAAATPAAPAQKHPPAPRDPKQREVGKPYTAPNGKTIIWRGNGWEVAQ